jgi:hypothetical protein
VCVEYDNERAGGDEARMKIEGVIWLANVVDKLAFKHHVEIYECE